MYIIANIEDANQVLAHYVPLAKEITGRDITLERMWPLLEKVGNPQNKLKIIHIAGTSGKTSTAYYISFLLRATGANVGLSVSPHIDSVTERVQINNQPLSEQDFCRYLTEFIRTISDIKPTYFELMIAFAYWVFARIGVDYVVAETGLGGLQDSTNVAQNADKVCVITDIGYDHMHVLGDTLKAIASQKAGIIHAHNHVFAYHQSPAIMQAIHTREKAQKANLHILKQPDLDQQFGNGTEVMALFQQRNWLLAREVCEYIINRDKLHPISSEKLLASQSIIIPARMDTSQIDGKTIVMDGAHNQQKMSAFVASFQSKYPNQKASVLFALKQDKDYGEVIDQLLPIADSLIITTFDTTQDLQVHSTEPKTLADYCQSKDFEKFNIISDLRDAYSALLASDNALLVVTGSFYLISQLRALKQSHD